MSKTTTALVAVASVTVIAAVAVAVYEANEIYMHRKQEEEAILEAMNEEGLDDA